MTNRLEYIEGIRGWAALIVLVFHLTAETFGESFPAYRNVVLHFLLDGPLAVYVFFILSGDALATTFLKTRNFSFLARLVVKRYFRLAGPILASCLIVYAIMTLRLNFNHEAAAIVHREDWLGSFICFPPRFVEAVKYGLLDVFVAHRKETSYNPFLWPMSYELYGSFMVFATLAIYAQLRRPLSVLLATAAWLTVLGSFYALFFMGVCFSAWRELGVFSRPRLKKWSFALITLAIVVDTMLSEFRMKPPQASVIIAACLVIGFYSNAGCLAFFSNRVSRYLGRISFPLYLTHFAIIVSFTSWAISWLATNNRLDFAHSLGVVAASCVFSLLFAESFTRAEQAYLRFLNRWVGRLVKD